MRDNEIKVVDYEGFAAIMEGIIKGEMSTCNDEERPGKFVEWCKIITALVIIFYCNSHGSSIRG